MSGVCGFISGVFFSVAVTSPDSQLSEVGLVVSLGFAALSIVTHFLKKDAP